MGNGISTVLLLNQFKTSQKVFYSRLEIAKHNTESSLWIISGNKVYDITSFYKNQTHPGGKEALLSRAGGVIDSSPDYRFHSKKTKRQWGNYLIGYVRENE